VPQASFVDTVSGQMKRTFSRSVNKLKKEEKEGRESGGEVMSTRGSMHEKMAARMSFRGAVGGFKAALMSAKAFADDAAAKRSAEAQASPARRPPGAQGHA
jgi:hypothetical protein